MDYSNLFIGLIAIVFGLFNVLIRKQGKLEKLGKLEMMKKRLGEKRGNFLHLFAYAILPIVCGLSLVVLSFLAK